MAFTYPPHIRLVDYRPIRENYVVGQDFQSRQTRIKIEKVTFFEFTKLKFVICMELVDI